MPLQAVTPRAGDFVQERREPKHEVIFRYNWQMSVAECGIRSYFARINESLVLNVHKRPNTRTWEYLVVGFDLTKPDAPVIGAVGTAGTMKEAKYLAEQKLPRNTPRMEPQLWDEEAPF